MGRPFRVSEMVARMAAEHLDIDIDALFADLFNERGEPIELEPIEDAVTLECDYVDIGVDSVRVVPR